MDRFIPWLSLKSVRGVGNHTFKLLVERFGSPENVFCASKKELLATTGITEKIASAILSHKPPDSIKKVLDACKRMGITVVTLNDHDYPALLKEIYDPPPYLYVLGRTEPDAACISIVGSRNPTSYGLAMATRLASDLAASGITVVSGMARGIDTAAHRGALKAGGDTYAVLGSGLARIYPPENTGLARDIAGQGAVISEFPVFSDPEPHHFPARNRIISGISLGTIVVEAAQRSGSLITARLAMEQNREVFAVPGSIKSAKSTGTHGLLKQGAALVENAADVLSGISHMLSHISKQDHLAGDNSIESGHTAGDKKKQPSLDMDEKLVLQTLEPYPIHIDDIARKIKMGPGKTAGILLRLELKGLVIQEPGKRFLLREGCIE